MIEKTWPKILFVNNHIIIQLSSLERIREYLSLKTEEDREATLATVSMELERIFDMLRNSKIDEAILRVNEERERKSQTMTDTNVARGDKPVTLFHYIDDQAVLELQRQADDEIGEVESLCASLVSITKALSNTIAELAALQESSLSISLEESVSDFANEKLQIQETEITKMADILTSLTNHYDQLGEATRLCQSDPEACHQLDITVLRDDHDHIPDILDDLHESMEIVDSLEQFGSAGGQADMICERMMTAEADMKERDYNLENYFKQLSSLAEWYRLYAASYGHLILEIERRRKVSEKQEKMRREILKLFEDTYEDELQERHRWFREHGEYLPQDLCPFIYDPPSNFTIAIEQEAGQLPRLSQATVDKVRVEKLSYHGLHQW
ncbi:autophagy-related protein 17 [Radiomyces spectabilis]|uniref:autophagy-related protein 17 n=1 Tax=Radiomyces spectabilis TaxID=64574 RepID=UPI00221F3F44|nr:autophagy-related protein 17 [Radiomyces spectabilis]KAI8388564.1 autophagy-related protein 17 [Radiomyces spectabilis]